MRRSLFPPHITRHIHSFLAVMLLSMVPAASAADDYLIVENRYTRMRTQFDSLLKKCADQKAVDALATSYKNGLTKLQTDISTTTPQLVPHVKAEIERVDSVSRNYLSNPAMYRRISLWDNWQTNNENKEAANDFRRVIGPGSSRSNTSPNILPDFGNGAVVQGKAYLCPIDEFVASVPGMKGLRATRSRVLIGMPGFPKGSFYYHSFDGNFSAPNVPPKLFSISYNRLYVLTDALDQVVGVQYTCESPQQHGDLDPSNLGIFNFAQFRRKGTSTAAVHYRFVEQPNQSWLQSKLLVNGTCKEVVMLVLPKPTLELVRHALAQQ